MTPPTAVRLAPDVNNWLLAAQDTPWLKDRFEKVRKAIKMMREVGPSHPGFCTHKMKNLPGPGGRPIWNSYVENRSSNAWRMYWIWDESEIYILSIGPHTHVPGDQPEVSRKAGKRKK